MIRLRLYKKESPESNIRPQGSIFSNVVLKWLAIFKPTTSGVSFVDVVVRPLHLFCTNGGVPVTIFQSGHISATPVQIDSTSANPMQTYGVSITPVQLGRVSAIMRMISAIGISLQQSTFSFSLLQKMYNIIALRPALFRSKQLYARIKQLYVQIIQSLLSYYFWSDKLVKLPCNQSLIALTMRGEG